VIVISITLRINTSVASDAKLLQVPPPTKHCALRGKDFARLHDCEQREKYAHLAPTAERVGIDWTLQTLTSINRI